MMTTPRTTGPAASARQARHRDLQAMLHDRQRDMQDVLQRRVRQSPSDRLRGGLDEPEHAEEDIQEHIEIALIHMKEDTLRRVREALVRLDAGEYGYCSECDGEISERRLRALPFAVRCAACEASHERHAALERRYGSPQGFRLVSPDMTV
jgi:DnaK suppressor protein